MSTKYANLANQSVLNTLLISCLPEMHTPPVLIQKVSVELDLLIAIEILCERTSVCVQRPSQNRELQISVH